MMLASGGMHGSQFGDRRYYYNIIKDMLEPVYYDWKPIILTENYIIESKNLDYNFSSSFEKAKVARDLRKIDQQFRHYAHVR